MEQTHTEQSTKKIPPNTAQNPLPQTPPLHHHRLLHQSDNINNRKRKVGDVDIHNSAYFKILDHVRQLRPHFIDVLKTPDFRNCDGAYRIRKRMKLMMDLYRQWQTEGNPIGNFGYTPAFQDFPGENKPEKEHLNDGVYKGGPKLEHFQHKQVSKNPGESDLPLLGNVFDDRSKRSYIVGGSALGWNFITYRNRKPPVYYGVKKESRRHGLSKLGNHKKPEAAAKSSK